MYRETILSPLAYPRPVIESIGLTRPGICSLVSVFFLFRNKIIHSCSVAHLGCEIKLRDAPQHCLVKGNLITPGTHVVIESAFNTDHPTYLDSVPRKTLGYLQRIPVAGRLLAHCTGLYWASLQGVRSGECEWIYE